MCEHKTYKKDCSHCEDIRNYAICSCDEYGLFEGYDVKKKKDWSEMKAYYEHFVDQEPDPDFEYDDQFRGGDKI